MALERNKSTMKFDPGCDPEFELMLRRRLKRGGAPVAACGGFDADMASAFLENALGPSIKDKFELHLADCPACRRHLIELSQLIAPIAEPITTQVKPDRLAGLKQWFDVSSWEWRWRTAGLAAAAVLIGVASIPLINSNSANRTVSQAFPSAAPSSTQPTEAVVARSAGDQPISARVVAESEPSAAPDSKDKDAVARNAFADSIASLSSPQITGPALAARSQDPSQAQETAMTAISNKAKSIELPKTLANFSGPIASYSQSGAELAAAPPSAPAPEPPRPSADAVAIAAPTFGGSQVGPSPDDNPMREEKSEKPRSSQSQRPHARMGVTSLLPIIRDRVDRDEKPAPAARDEEESRPLLWKHRNRSFRFENDAWVDEDYKPNMRWRVIKLIRGSNEYESVLASEPQLKGFFEKAPILVMWHDKIYKIVVIK